MKTIWIVLAAFGLTFSSLADTRPNILWICIDDMSANFSCYGEKTITTPAVDALAQEGLKFSRAYATSPVCSTFRSALITGMYQNSIGSHHHRSGRGEHRITLPAGVRPLPEIFQDAGYWTCSGSGLPGVDRRSNPTSKKEYGKTDYNFDWDRSMFDSHDWAERKDGQPFFMQVQIHGGKLRGASVNHYDRFDAHVKREFGSITAPENVELPPYYPRDPVFLRDWSTYLDSVRITDLHVKRVMARLEKEGLLDNTYVIFFTDHGISHARGKQFLYDEGTHIPLIIRGPGIKASSLRDDLVEHIDIAALSLAAAGIKIPPTMQGQNILAPNHQPKATIFAARDRCGDADDRIRSVRSDRYLYIRNFYPSRPLLQPSGYKDAKLIVKRLRELHAAGKTSALTDTLLFAPTRPLEELYEYGKDGWQIQNLAASPELGPVLEGHRNQLKKWIVDARDPGPESPEVYTLETDDQLSSMKPNSSGHRIYRANAEMYKKWRSQRPHIDID
jgi:arylsulfatase A-like enzyme